MSSMYTEVPDTCEKHGDFIAKQVTRNIRTKCPVCQAELNAQQEAKRKEQEKAAHEAWLMRKVVEAGIPTRYHEKTLETLISKSDKQSAVIKFVTDYAHNFEEHCKTGKSAIFLGTVGTGKTHAACGIAQHIIRNMPNHDARYTTVQRIMRSIKATFSKDSEYTERDVMEHYCDPDLLVIDEIGVQSGSNFECNTLFDILNDRYENRKPVILMSNLTKEEVVKFLGERVMDRLREDGGTIVPFTWESFRGKN